MLLEIRIGNLALADDVIVALRSGFTVITGETGAGKSMIAGALALLAGARADREIVRAGEDLAFVEGVFDLAQRDDLVAMAARLGVIVGDDAILVLRREVRREGRGRVVINGLVSSLAVLERLGAALVAIQSQDQVRELATAGFARDHLDASLEHEPLRERVVAALAALRAAEAALTRRQEEARQTQEQFDLWRYQHEELAAARLRAGEEEELAEQIALKRHAHAMQQAAAAALAQLEEGETPARDALGAAESALGPHVGRHPRLAAAAASLTAAADQAAEAAASLRRFLDQLELDPRGLDELETRKALYEELRRKYRRDVVGLLDLAGALAGRLERAAASDRDLADLADGLARARADLETAAGALTVARRQGAPRVAAAALAVIRPLALPNLELEFVVTPQRDIDGTGGDRVDFLARTNPGESRGPVEAIASGGERSRIHLGLTVLRQDRGAAPAVRLFDEVDAGLGMDAAPPVAELLRRLARHGQVLCITHLPTMAVQAEHHLVVTKHVAHGRTSLRVRTLDADGRIAEVARLLGGEGYGGDDCASQLAYARQLLATGGAAVAGA